MAIAALVEHGSLQTYDFEDETGLLVKGVTFSAKREYVMKKGQSRQVTYIRGENPTLSISINGTIVPSTGSPQGVAAASVGAAATLANFSSDETVNGFVGSDAKLILFKDGTRTLTDGNDEPQFAGEYEVFPGITPA